MWTGRYVISYMLGTMRQSLSLFLGSACLSCAVRDPGLRFLLAYTWPWAEGHLPLKYAHPSAQARTTAACPPCLQWAEPPCPHCIPPVAVSPALHNSHTLWLIVSKSGPHSHAKSILGQPAEKLEKERKCQVWVGQGDGGQPWPHLQTNLFEQQDNGSYCIQVTGNNLGNQGQVQGPLETQ